MFHLAGAGRDVVFTGDAAKNRAELLSGDVDMTFDAAVSRASIEMIHGLWRARPGTVLIPGHDLPMVLGSDGRPAYLGLAPAEALDCPLATLDRKLGHASGPRCEIIVPPRS